MNIKNHHIKLLCVCVYGSNDCTYYLKEDPETNSVG